MSTIMSQRRGRVIEVSLPHRWVCSTDKSGTLYGVAAHMATYSNRACMGTPISQRDGVYYPNEEGKARFTIRPKNTMKTQDDRQLNVGMRLMELLYAHLDDTSLEVYEKVHTMCMFVLSTRPGCAVTLDDVKGMANLSIDLKRVRILAYPSTPIVKPPILPPTRLPVSVCADVLVA